MSDPIVGIDLGTSNSVVAYCDATGAVRVLADDSGHKIHPSVVSFHPSGGVVVGQPAKQRKVIDPQNTIYSVKRLVGRTYNSTEVQTAKQRSPFQIKEGANQMPMIVTRGGEFAVPEISALVLDHVRNIAGTTLDTEVSRAVVTVPASFNDAQRTATATAGAIAGITVVRVLNEPTAAALAYGHARNLRQIIAVYDFGGGTFDVTLLKLQDEIYEVLGTAGDSFLGGDDLDERIVDKMVNRFLADNRIDLRTNEVSMMRLRAVAEQTKIELSRRSRAVVRVDEIAYGPKGVALNLQIEVTRDEFVTTCADIIDRTFPVCTEALKLAGLDASQIDDIVLVGGTTKIPYVRDQVSKFFNKAPRTDVNPEEAVAFGAALQASALDRALRPGQTGVTKLPGLEKTEGDYSDFAKEDESYTDAQGMKSEPTDPRARIAAAAEAARQKKPSSVSSTDELEVEDTAVRPMPTAPVADEKRPSGVYSAKGAADKFEDKPGAPGARGPAPAGLERMGKVPARTFGKPLEKVTALPPNPKGKGFVPGQTPTPPTGKPMTGKLNFGTPQFGEKRQTKERVPGMEDTAVADSAVAVSHAPTMVHMSEDPLPKVDTRPGVGGQTREPTLVPAPGIEDMLPPGTLPPTMPTAVAPPPVPKRPPNRPPQSFPAMPDPDPSPTAPPSAPTMMMSSPVGPPGATMAGQAVGRGGRQTPSPPMATNPFADPLGTLPAAKPYAPPQSPPTVPQALPMAQTMAAAMPPPPPQQQGNPFAVSGQAQQPFPSPPPEQEFPPHTRPAARGKPPSVSPDAHPFLQPIPGAPMPAPQVRSPVILDVTPRGLGIGTVAGYCEELIRRNSHLPAEMKKTFSTSRDNQELVRIVVCQGESRRLDNNIILGDLVLEGLPQRERGETSIEVTFTVDVSGILRIHAKDTKTGTEQRASLDLLGAMPDEDVEEAQKRLQALKR